MASLNGAFHGGEGVFTAQALWNSETCECYLGDVGIGCPFISCCRNRGRHTHLLRLICMSCKEVSEGPWTHASLRGHCSVSDAQFL